MRGFSMLLILGAVVLSLAGCGTGHSHRVTKDCAQDWRDQDCKTALWQGLGPVSAKK